MFLPQDDEPVEGGGIINLDLGTEVLYRVYDQRDELLYIGISNNIFARLGLHCRESAWWGQATRYTYAVYPDRRSVRRAKCKAIRDEHPKHNTQHVRAA